MVRKMLHGLDGSDGSFRAFASAVDLARLSNAELHTISIEEVPSYAETIGEVVEEKLAANGKYGEAILKAKGMASDKGVKIQTHVLVGHEVKSIVEFIKQHDFDLLVIGFMGRSALYERIMGGTCQNLVRLAPCSVLVVK